MIIFLTPLALLGLLTLPLVWWLLKATPPAARPQRFPPIQILRQLRARESDVARSPLWLLLVRLAAVCLLVLGLAHPVLPGDRVQSTDHGTLLLVVDDDMLAASSWAQRMATARSIVEDAAHAHRRVILLRTAAVGETAIDQDTLTPRDTNAVLQDITALHSQPWGTDRAATAQRLEAHPPADIGSVFYLANGVASSGDAAFATALRRFGKVQEIRFTENPVAALVPAPPHSGSILARLVALPDPTAPRAFTVRVHTQDGGTLAVVPVTLPAGASSADVPVDLPNTVKNRIDQIALTSPSGPAATVLLDEGDRLRPVGLMTSGAADTPLIGPLFYLRRALAPTADLHEGTGATLLAQPLSIIIAPDGTLTDPALRKKITEWVKNGGTLIRFAGPALAGAHHDTADAQATTQEQPDQSTPSAPTDDLLPVALLDGSRQLGGTMTWGAPQKLAPFDTNSPFHGLAIPADVTISRQVLASPAANLADHSWAKLADGTPLVTHSSLGKGDIVLFHISSTADWSNLPLSGLFVAMLQRLTDHANGVSIPADDSMLVPVMTLDGEGVLGPPPPSARGLKASAFANTPVSPAHPPGLYGPRAARRALNAGMQLDHMAPALPVGTLTNPAGRRPDTPLGRYCLIAAAMLLLLDAALVLLMRSGFLFGKSPRRPKQALSIALLLSSTLAAGYVHAEPEQHGPSTTIGQQTVPSTGNQPASTVAPPAPTTSPTAPSVPGAALETRLAYVLTGHEDVDAVSRQGLQGLSDYANARTSAKLGHPDGVRPGQDDLSYYPLLYWPITPDARPTAAQTAALTSFMAHGGILLIDTQGQDSASQQDENANGSFAGDAPGTRSALRRVTSGLPIPPLAPMTDHHLLAHTFYMLHDFPGRYAGQPVWVAREGEAENDDVSPVIIGSADWAHAWAVDDSGNTPFAVIPEGADQRQMAYRFGVNAVIYALTGNYKADQVHVPMLLKRLGE